jgi:alanyl aminopeptidase
LRAAGLALLTSLVALTVACGRAPDPAQVDSTPPSLRLPGGVTPLNYRLDLSVFPDRKSFDGHVRIDIRFDAPTNGFWIHGRDLTVDKVVLIAGNKTVPATYRQSTPEGVARIDLDHTIEAQTARLDVNYRGQINETPAGIFHVQVDGAWYAFTQFEPVDARAVFPSFDEPGFKTPFTLSIVAPKGAIVAANTEAAEILTLPDDTQRVRFEPTPPLPTYLVALTVGPLDVASGTPLPGSPAVPLRGIGVKGRGTDFGYALKHTPEIVARLADYFAMPYPFTKLDVVAVPSQQSAMENAALITYGEYSMLLGDDAPLAQQIDYACVHAHELAHQWFGDSVTMRWWDDLWLNEAFAEFLSYKIVDEWQPGYHAAEDLVHVSLAAMAGDGLASARRIREPIESVNDIINAFDDITYSKGAGVLNMLDGYLGAAAFRDGIRAYLKQHAGGSADMHDLIEALNGVSPNKDIEQIVRTFTEQPGTPWLDVDVDCNTTTPFVKLNQRRYLPVGSKADPNVTWHVPVCLRFAADGRVHEQCTVLTQPSATVALDGGACPTWLMPNRGGRGYYRWHLNDTQLAALTAVMFTSLDAGERLSLADGLTAGVAAGAGDLTAFFRQIPHLLERDDRYLMVSPVPLWRAIQLHMLTEAGESSSRARMRALYGPVLTSLRGRDLRDEGDRLLLAALIDLLAIDARDSEIRRELGRAAGALVGFGGDGRLHREALDSNLWVTALQVAARELDPAFGDYIAALVVKTTDPLLRRALLRAIGDADDAALAQQLALGGLVTGEELPELLQAMFGPEQRQRNWPWFTANVDELIDAVTPFGRGSLIAMTADFCSEPDADAVAALFEPLLDRIDGGQRTLEQTLEQIRLCAALKETYQDEARRLFK